MADKMPFMPFYGVDFYEDESVALMSLEEEAVYLRLLWRQWREGSLPAEAVDLERLARGPVTPRILALIPRSEDNRRRSPKLERVRSSHLDHSERLSEAGRRGRAKQLAEAGSGQAGGRPGGGRGQARAGLGQSEPETEPETEKEKTYSRTAYSDDFQSAWLAYPKRTGHSKAAAWRAWQARVQAGEQPGVMLTGISAYAAACLRDKTDHRFVKHMATFLGPDRHYLNDYSPPASDPEPEGIVYVDEIRARQRAEVSRGA